MTHFKAFLTDYLAPYDGRVLLIGAADYSNPALRIDEYLVSFPRKDFPMASRVVTQVHDASLSQFLQSAEAEAADQLDVAKSVFELKLNEEHPGYYRDYYLALPRRGLVIDSHGLKRLQLDGVNSNHFLWIAAHSRVGALSEALSEALKLPRLFSEQEPFYKE